MRLKDADALKRDMKEYLDKIPCENVPPRSAIVHCMVLTDEQPTAYDVDKVVEKLEAKKIHRFHEASGRSNYKSLAQGYIQAIQDAIDIVKRGGIE